MDVAFVVRHRLEQLGFEQRDLAAAARVTESYISQLLTRRKAPPSPDRTDIYDRMGRFLKLPSGELEKLAGLERQEELNRRLADPPPPLFQGVRDLVLRKCNSDKRNQIRVTFEKQPFGELERLVTQKLLDVVKRIAKDELQSENWLHLIARLNNRSYEDMRVAILEFLDTDVFEVSIENCTAFLDPLIESWDIDLATFGMDIVLNQRVAPEQRRRIEFVEKEPEAVFNEEPGLKQFLADTSLSRGTTQEEIEFLKKLRFKGKRPTSLYYYRELQNLRDPLHFRVS